MEKIIKIKSCEECPYTSIFATTSTKRYCTRLTRLIFKIKTYYGPPSLPKKVYHIPKEGILNDCPLEDNYNTLTVYKTKDNPGSIVDLEYAGRRYTEIKFEGETALEVFVKSIKEEKPGINDSSFKIELDESMMGENRCELCPFLNTKGKHCVCYLSNRIIPDVTKKPSWCKKI